MFVAYMAIPLIRKYISHSENFEDLDSGTPSTFQVSDKFLRSANMPSELMNFCIKTRHKCPHSFLLATSASKIDRIYPHRSFALQTKHRFGDLQKNAKSKSDHQWS